MQRTGTFRSQRLSTEVKGFIGWTVRHVDNKEEGVSSTIVMGGGIEGWNDNATKQ